MAAPTFVSFSQSNFADNNLSAEAATASWQSGDLIVVIGQTGDNGGTLTTPTATGLTFALATGLPTNTASSTKAYVWTATAASTGTSVSIGSTHGGTSQFSGLYVWVYRNTGGLGTVAASASGTGLTASLARAGSNSAVVWAGSDWNATNDTVVTATPASASTQRNAQFITSQFTTFAFDWSDEGSAGTTSYGITGFTTPANFTKVAVEVTGTAGGGGTATVKNLAALGVG